MSTSTPTVNATTSLLERAAALGITLSVHDGLVVADVPETAEATALLAQLAASKAAILATLTASQNSQNTPADWPNVDPRLMVASPAAQSRALALAEGCGWPAISLWGEPLGPGAERWQAVVAGLNTLAIGAL